MNKDNKNTPRTDNDLDTKGPFVKVTAGMSLEALRHWAKTQPGPVIKVNVDEDQFKEFLSFIHLDSEEPAEEQQGVAPDEF